VEHAPYEAFVLIPLYNLTTLETIVADFGDKNKYCRRIRQQSPFLATVTEFGDYKLSRQCGQGFTVALWRHVVADGLATDDELKLKDEILLSSFILTQ